MREKKKYIFGFLTRKWKVGSWCIYQGAFPEFAKTCTAIDRHNCILRRALVASYLLFVSVACRADVFMHRLCFSASITHVTYVFFYEKDIDSKTIHHEKWRNFDKSSLKAFNQIELKKMKALPNTLWGDFKKKNMFCKHVNKSAFLFSWGNSNLFKTCFFLGSLFPQNDPHVKSFFDTKVEANFHQNLQYDTYQSDIHTSLALLGFCLKPIVPK